MGEDRACSGTYAGGDDVTGVFVGDRVALVLTNEVAIATARNGAVHDDDGAMSAEADSEASERGADEPSQTRTGRVGASHRQLIRRHDSWEQGDGRGDVDLVRIA